MLEASNIFLAESSDESLPKTKTCSTCKIEKPIIEFTRNKSQPTGYMCYCKDCNNKRNKKFRRDPNNLKRACARVFSYIARRVRVKNLSIDIDVSFIEHLYNIQGGRCAYTGDNLSLESGLNSTMSVDRVDSSKGYTKDNVKLVTWEVNNMKQSASMKEFLVVCKKVLANAPH